MKMTKILKLLRSDIALTLLGGIAIGSAALSIVEPLNADNGHAKIYSDTRSITVEQSLAKK